MTIEVLRHHKKTIKEMVTEVTDAIARDADLTLERAIGRVVGKFLDELSWDDYAGLYQLDNPEQRQIWRETFSGILESIFLDEEKLKGFPDPWGGPGDLICEVCPAYGIDCKDARSPDSAGRSLSEFWAGTVL